MAIASTIRNEMNSSICNPSHAYNKHTKQLGEKRLDCSAIVQQGACLDQILLYGLLHEGVKLHAQRNLCIIQWLHSSPPYGSTACTTSSQYKWNHFRSGSSPSAEESLPPVFHRASTVNHDTCVDRVPNIESSWLPRNDTDSE